MPKYNATNVRIKRDYFAFLKEAKRQSESSVDAAAAAIASFEAYTRHRNFKAFHVNQAIGFKAHLKEKRGRASKLPLTKATLYASLSQLKRFFQWLASQPGYRSHLTYPDAEYFSLSEKDTRVATARRDRPAPTLDQVKHTLGLMPDTTAIQQRDRALFAFTLLTGARDGAIASMKLKHVDLTAGCVFQDAREVNTKFSKTFVTYFFPVGDEVLRVVERWIGYLRTELLWGNDDPLFPATKVAPGETGQFETVGLDRKHWSTATPIRPIFRAAFASAHLPYFNPHSFRNTLAQLGESLCRTPEQFKAWSQNLGHDQVLTTFMSYGNVATTRQADIIRSLNAAALGDGSQEDEELVSQLFRMIKDNRRVATGT